MISLKQGANLLLLVLLSLSSQIEAAAAPFDIDLKALERQEPAASAKPVKKKAQNAKTSPAAADKSDKSDKARQSPAGASGEVRYTVQPGDHIFKILVVRLGMSNEAAERLIPEILRLNNISNIKRLAIGQIILIPGQGQERIARTARRIKTHDKAEALEAAAPPEKSSARLDPETAASSQDIAPSAARVPPPPEKKSAEIGLAPAQPVPVAVPPVPSTGTPVPSVAKPAPSRSTVQPVPSVAKPASSAAPSATAAAPSAPKHVPLAAPPVAAVAPQIPAAPAVPVANTWICSVTDREPSRIIDAVLNALSVSWSKNRIIQATAPTTFSIRVDRSFEFRDGRYVVSIGELDPYNYTLIRLLEGAGYRVLRISGKEDFETVNRKILALIGVAPDFGKHVLQGGRTASGFLVQQEDAGGRRVIISNEPADPRHKWVLAQGCGAR